MNFIVMLEGGLKLAQHGERVAAVHAVSVVAFEGLDESFRHAVGLRARNRRRQWLQADLPRKRPRVARNVRGAVVGQPFDRLRWRHGTEARFYRFDHQVAHDVASDAAVVATQVIASRSQQSRAKAILTAHSFIDYYGLRASAAFRRGAHDEWNIVAAINQKRSQSPTGPGVPGLLPVVYDGNAIEPGDFQSTVVPGNATNSCTPGSASGPRRPMLNPTMSKAFCRLRRR